MCAQLGRARWRIESGLRVEVVQELCAVDPELGWLVDVAKYGVPVGYVGVFPTGRVRNHRSAEEARGPIGGLIAEEEKKGMLLDVTELLAAFPAARGRNAPVAARPKGAGGVRMLVDHTHWVHGAPTGVNAGTDARALGLVEMARVWKASRSLRRLAAQCGPDEEVRLQVLDITAAFRQVPVCAEDWPLLLLEWQGRSYWDTRLPMGGTWSPYWMCRISAALARFAMERLSRDEGRRVLVAAYVDDFLVAEVVRRDATETRAAAMVQTLLDRVGLAVSRSKLTETGPPAVRKRWLGYEWDMASLTARIPSDKVREAKRKVRSVLRSRRPSTLALQELAGYLQHLAAVVLPGRAFLWATARWASMMKHAAETRSVLPTAVVEELDWWRSALRRRGAMEWPLPRSMAETEVFVATDASTASGGGFVCGTRGWRVRWTRPWESKHSTHLEVLMVLVAFRHLAPEWSGKAVRLQVDNQAADLALKAGRAASPVLTRLLRQILLLCATHRFQFFSGWVEDKDNREADDLSRGRLAEWRARNPHATLRWVEEPSEISWLEDCGLRLSADDTAHTPAVEDDGAPSSDDSASTSGSRRTAGSRSC